MKIKLDTIFLMLLIIIVAIVLSFYVEAEDKMNDVKIEILQADVKMLKEAK